MTRIGRLLVVLGIIAILLTMYSGSMSRPILLVVQRGSPDGIVFEASQDVLVNVTLVHPVGTFNMYFLHWQDANDTMALNRSLHPLSPIGSFENITSFYDVLHLPFQGTFALLFSTNLTVNATALFVLSGDISTHDINTIPLAGGLVLAACGIMILIYERIHGHRTGGGFGNTIRNT
jgi:hypothetical protein